MSKSLILALAALACLIHPSLASAQSVLENPEPGASESGIGLVSGWKCSATRIDVTFDGVHTLQAAYGTSREDTRSTCGDADNGFGLLINWNLLGDGQHTISVSADGIEFANTTFTVHTMGAEFMTGLSGNYVLPDFPEAGRSVRIQWQESAQNFVIIDGGIPVPVPTSTPVSGEKMVSGLVSNDTCTQLFDAALVKFNIQPGLGRIQFEVDTDDPQYFFCWPEDLKFIQNGHQIGVSDFAADGSAVLTVGNGASACDTYVPGIVLTGTISNFPLGFDLAAGFTAHFANVFCTPQHCGSCDLNVQ